MFPALPNFTSILIFSDISCSHHAGVCVWTAEFWAVFNNWGRDVKKKWRWHNTNHYYEQAAGAFSNHTEYSSGKNAQCCSWWNTAVITLRMTLRLLSYHRNKRSDKLTTKILCWTLDINKDALLLFFHHNFKHNKINHLICLPLSFSFSLAETRKVSTNLFHYVARGYAEDKDNWMCLWNNLHWIVKIVIQNILSLKICTYQIST